MARLGVPVSGRVRKLRAVEDQSAPIPEERTSKLGKINLWSLAAALLDSLFEHPASRVPQKHTADVSEPPEESLALILKILSRPAQYTLAPSVLLLLTRRVL